MVSEKLYRNTLRACHFLCTLGNQSLYLISYKNAFCLAENAKYNLLRIFKFSTGAIAFETAKITYIAGATENKQLVQEARFSF